MTTITIDRALLEQALDAIESDTVLFSAWTEKMTAARTALRAALAQEQAEPVQESDSPERRCGGPGCDGTCCQPVQEPVDVGLLEYRGNSVAFIHQKMTAYRTGIDAAWDAFRANGLHPDGKTSLADMIAKYTAPPKAEPLTEEEIDAMWREAVSAEGFTTAQFVRNFARAVERTLEEKNRGR